MTPTERVISMLCMFQVFNSDLQQLVFRWQDEKEDIRKYMEMVAQREARAEEERLRKKAAADAAFKAVVEQTEKQNNEEDELRMLRCVLSPVSPLIVEPPQNMVFVHW